MLLDVHLFLTTQVACREGLGLHHVSRAAHEDDLAAEASRTGAHVYDMVGLKHHILIVLHDDDSIAEVAQLLQGVDEA